MIQNCYPYRSRCYFTSILLFTYYEIQIHLSLESVVSFVTLDVIYSGIQTYQPHSIPGLSCNHLCPFLITSILICAKQAIFKHINHNAVKFDTNGANTSTNSFIPMIFWDPSRSHFFYAYIFNHFRLAFTATSDSN